MLTVNSHQVHNEGLGNPFRVSTEKASALSPEGQVFPGLLGTSSASMKAGIYCILLIGLMAGPWDTNYLGFIVSKQQNR